MVGCSGVISAHVITFADEASKLVGAAQLAGLLAEAGVALLFIDRPGQSPQSLPARATDLPGVLASAPVGSVLRWHGGSAAVRERDFVINSAAAPNQGNAQLDP